MEVRSFLSESRIQKENNSRDTRFLKRIYQAVALSVSLLIGCTSPEQKIESSSETTTIHPKNFEMLKDFESTEVWQKFEALIDGSEKDRRFIFLATVTVLKSIGFDFRFVCESGIPPGSITKTNFYSFLSGLSLAITNFPNIQPEELRSLHKAGIEWWLLKSDELYFYLRFNRHPIGKIIFPNPSVRKKMYELLRYLVGSGDGFYYDNYDYFLHDGISLHMCFLLLEFPDWPIQDVVNVTSALALQDEKGVLKSFELTEDQKTYLEKIRKIILIVREQNKDVPVFYPGRTVSIFAHGEKSKNNQFRFANQEVLHRIKRICHTDPSVFRAPELNGDEEKKKTQFDAFKQAIRQRIIHAPLNHAYVFAGHGSSDAFAFYGGESPGVVSEDSDCLIITKEEMADIFRARYQHPLYHESRDVIIMASCLSATVCRYLQSQLAPLEASIIFLTPSEYQLLSVSDPSAPTNCALLEVLLPKNGSSSCLGDVLKYDQRRFEKKKNNDIPEYSPSIVVPVDPSTLPQENRVEGIPAYIQIGQMSGSEILGLKC